MEAALDADHPCALCRKTLELFMSILGAEAGNMALKVYATGGVYLGGGIPPRIRTALEQSSFLDAFCDKGRLSDLVSRIPVSIILNPKTALIGAACCGLGMLE
jgi:glucokinase